MDQEWLTSFDRSHRRFRAVLDEVLDLLDAHADERFTLDGVPFLDALRLDGPSSSPMDYSSAYHRLYVVGLELGHAPQARTGTAALARMRELVATGRLELVGTFVQPDTNLPSGEALVRQCLEARQWYAEHLGATPHVGWNMDCFGQSAQLPQILRTCGYDGLLAFRTGPVGDPSVSGAPDGLEPAFRFQGIDGSEVLTHVMPLGYSPGVTRFPRIGAWASTVGRLPRAVTRLLALSGAQPVLVPFGTEFSGALPGVRPLLRRIRHMAPGRGVTLGAAEEYFAALAPLRDGLPLHTGDLNPVYPGTHALRPEVKRADRLLTADLLTTEALDALLSARGLAGPAAAELREGWHRLLTNQAHDSICGCHVPAVTDDVLRRAREGHARVACVAAPAMERLGADALGGAPTAQSPTSDRPIVVFNSLGWDRADLARVPWSGPLPARVMGPDGQELAFRTRETVDGVWIEVACPVPAFGYALLRACAGDPPPSQPAAIDAAQLDAGPSNVVVTAEGGFRLRVDGDLVADGGALQLEEDRGNAYLPQVGRRIALHGPATWRAERTPVGRRLILDGPLGDGHARAVLEAVEGRTWIGLRLDGSGIPDGSRVRLPLALPTGSAARYAVPYGEMDRTGPAAVRTYVRIRGRAGVANLDVPSHEFGPGSVDLVAVRSVRLLSHKLPLLRLRIPIDAVVPTGWSADLALAADARKAGAELNRPLLGQVVPGAWPAGAEPTAGRLLPCPDGPDSVAVTAIKRPFEGQGLVLRLVNRANGSAAVTLRFPSAGRVRRTDATEAQGTALRARKGAYRVKLRGWEIATVVWRPRRG